MAAATQNDKKLTTPYGQIAPKTACDYYCS